MIDVARGLAAILVALGAVPIWFGLGPGSPAPALAATDVVETVEEVAHDGCVFLLRNQYDPETGRQRAVTKQDWEPEVCTFGGRRGSIRVKVCFADPGDRAPFNCSESLMPTSGQPLAELIVTTSAPRDSIHYIEISDISARHHLAVPDVPPSPSLESAPAQEPFPPTPSTTANRPDVDPSPPATTGPAAEGDLQPADARQPQQPAPRQDNRNGLAAVLATGGAALLGLGGAGIWLLRRGGSGHW